MSRGRTLWDLRDNQPVRGQPVAKDWLLLIADPTTKQTYAITVEELKEVLRD